MGNSRYRFRVQALNTVGLGAHSPDSAAITTKEVPPFAPGKPWVSDIQQYLMLVSWNSPTNDGGFDILGYKIWMRQNVNLPWIVAINDTESNRSSASIEGLLGYTDYQFKIAALNLLGVGNASEDSDIVRTLPVPPDEPRIPTLTGITQSSIDVDWAAPRNGGSDILGYVVLAMLVRFQRMEILSCQSRWPLAQVG
jgi:titin